MADIKKAQCDCLNYCGDDPWLKDGRAEPCEVSKCRSERDAAAQEERARIHELVNGLADSAMVYGSVDVSAKDLDDIRRALVSGGNYVSRA